MPIGKVKKSKHLKSGFVFVFFFP